MEIHNNTEDQRFLALIIATLISCQIQYTFKPFQALAFDENMVAWRGKETVTVYNPDQPIKYDLKAYMLCDALNAFCLQFIMTIVLQFTA